MDVLDLPEEEFSALVDKYKKNFPTIPEPGVEDLQMFYEEENKEFDLGKYVDEMAHREPVGQMPGGGIGAFLKRILGNKTAGPAMQEGIDKMYPAGK